jgi:hypothetical protein
VHFGAVPAVAAKTHRHASAICKVLDQRNLQTAQKNKLASPRGNFPIPLGTPAALNDSMRPLPQMCISNVMMKLHVYAGFVHFGGACLVQMRKLFQQVAGPLTKIGGMFREFLARAFHQTGAGEVLFQCDRAHCNILAPLACLRFRCVTLPAVRSR